MINYKDLTCEQLQALEHMAYFNCGKIDCGDCPLYNPDTECGSILASDIIDEYYKEINQ